MSSADPDDGPSHADSPRAIVAGHGDFPDGLVSAVHQISGKGGTFLALSNHGLSGEDIEGRLREQMTLTGVQVFFTDLPGGSATLAVRRIMRTNPDVVLVTGANLAALLDFVFQFEGNPGDAARRAAERGRAALGAYGGAS